MTLTAWLQERREGLLARWLDHVLATYPAESARFLREERDRFRYPVGTTLRRELGALLDVLLAGGPAAEARRAVAAVVRLRAVQQLTPGAAVAFVPLLKRVVQEELGAEAGPRAAELLALFAHLDELTLEAVNELVACREQVYRLRVREARGQVYSLLRRAGLLEVLEAEDAGKGG